MFITVCTRDRKKDIVTNTAANKTRTSAVGRFVGTFKRFCNKFYGENIWQNRYYDHVVRNRRDYDEIWEYIEYNSQKYINTKELNGVSVDKVE